MVQGADASIVDLRAARGYRPDLASLARAQLRTARRVSGLAPAAFAAALTEHLGWPISTQAMTGWETAAVPPGDVLIAADMIAGQHTDPQQAVQLITDYADLQAALTSVVTSARTMLAITGSRSRDPDYLARIEQALSNCPGMVHYRVLYGPPRHGATKNHLLRLVDLGLDPGRLHIGIARDMLHDQERFICASESQAVVVLPSLTSLANFDTGLYVTDPGVASQWAGHVRQAWFAADPIASRKDVEDLKVV